MRGLSKLRALHQQTGHLAPTQKCLSLSTAAVKTDGQNNGSGGSQEEGGSQRVMQSLAAAAAVAAVAAALNDRFVSGTTNDRIVTAAVTNDRIVTALLQMTGVLLLLPMTGL